MFAAFDWQGTTARSFEIAPLYFCALALLADRSYDQPMLELDGKLRLGGIVQTNAVMRSVRDPRSADPNAKTELAFADRVLAAEAIEAATRGFTLAKKLSTRERRTILHGIAQRLEAERETFARLVAIEVGKPLALARVEVDRAVMTFTIAAEETMRPDGETLPLDLTDAAKGYRGIVRRVPSGPVLAIAPFNFPLNLVAHKIAPALAAGCSVLLKPPPQAPFTSIALHHVAIDAGVHPDIFTVLPCDNDVAETLVASDSFATLSFTGSANVGWKLKSVAGKKRTLLELGGNAAAVVHADAGDLDRVAALVARSAFAYAGQVCIKTQRLYVERSIADAFIPKVIAATKTLKVGDALDETVTIGPMIDEANAKRVESWVAEAVAFGAAVRVLLEGKRNGATHSPTILAIDGSIEDTRHLKVVGEEIFGPVLTVHLYDDWSDALHAVNGTRYGLQCGLFTDSQSRIDEAFDTLDVGGIIVGDTASFRVDSMPYGGNKDSGFGREGVRYAMQEMSESKLLVTAPRSRG